MTTREVAAILGITRQRVQQLDALLAPEIEWTSGTRSRTGRGTGVRRRKYRRPHVMRIARARGTARAA